MTSTPAASNAHPHFSASPSRPNLVREVLQDTVTITRRDMVRTARQPEMLAFAVIMGVFFLLLFNYVFGGAIGAGTGVDYIQFVVPGVLVITALQGAQQTGIGLATDLTEGVTDRFRSLPPERQEALVDERFSHLTPEERALILRGLRDF